MFIAKQIIISNTPISFCLSLKDPALYLASYNTNEGIIVSLKKLGFTKFNHKLKFDLQSSLYIGNNGFICIWNVGTPEFKDVVDRYSNKFDIDAFHDLVNEEDVSDRGNVQIAYGFAHMNVKGREQETNLNKPQIKKGTNEFVI
jgi:hypothetical protein